MNIMSYILRKTLILVRKNLIPPPVVKVILKFENKRRYRVRKHYFDKLKSAIQPTTSIFCNNCFGARISQDLGYQYNSPIAGLKFPEMDYHIFLENLSEALKAELKFRNRSKYENFDENIRQNYLIGYLDVEGKDIEIWMVHYKDEQIAKEKWERRCKRVNFNDIVIIETSYDETTEKEVDAFLKLPFAKKVYFSDKKLKIHNPNFFCVKEVEGRGIAPYAEAHILYKYMVQSDWIHNFSN